MSQDNDYKELLVIQQTMIRNLKEENENLRQKNKELEISIKNCEKELKGEKELSRKKDRDNYDMYMISFKEAPI